MRRPLLLLIASVLGLGLPLGADAAGGDLDPSFGSGGELLTDLGNANQSNARAVAIQADGKIVAAGFSAASTNYDDHFALARVHSDGKYDQTFGSGGKVLTDFGGGSTQQAHALAIQP